jgi:hypothetical protein
MNLPVPCRGALADGTWRADPAPSTTTSRLGPRHAASITDGRAAAKVDDVTVETLKAIFAAGPRRGL